MRKLNNELREAVALPPEITAAEILITEQWPWGGWPVGHCSSNHNNATDSTSQSHAIKPQYVPNKYLLFYHVIFRLTFEPFSETVTIFICSDIGTTYITSTVRNNSYTGFTPSPQFPEWVESRYCSTLYQLPDLHNPCSRPWQRYLHNIPLSVRNSLSLWV